MGQLFEWAFFRPADHKIHVGLEHAHVFVLAPFCMARVNFGSIDVLAFRGGRISGALLPVLEYGSHLGVPRGHPQINLKEGLLAILGE